MWTMDAKARDFSSLDWLGVRSLAYARVELDTFKQGK